MLLITRLIVIALEMGCMPFQRQFLLFARPYRLLAHVLDIRRCIGADKHARRLAEFNVRQNKMVQLGIVDPHESLRARCIDQRLELVHRSVRF